MNPEEEAKAKQEGSEDKKAKKEEGKDVEPEVEPEKEEPKPKEPEIKIPTDFSAEIGVLSKYKADGNAQVQTNVDGAIKIYEEGHKYYEEFMKKGNAEREYNPQIKEIETVDKLILSNLALCYTKQSKYEQAIQHDLKIISIDSYFDKSYVRLYKNYKALNNIDFAVHFGLLLKTYFTAETTEKHKELIAEIEAEDKKIKDQYEEKRKTEAKNYRNEIIMKFLPAVILGIAGLIYYFFFKKPAPIQAPVSNLGGFNNTTSTFNETDFGLDANETDLGIGEVFNGTNSTE